MVQRLTKAMMCLAIGLFAALVTFDNVVDYGSNYAFVQHVLSMDTIPKDNSLAYRAVTSPAAWRFAYAFIIAAECVVALLFLIGAYALWTARSEPSAEFQRAKRWPQAAAALGFLLWFFGFLVVGGEWFAMWRSPRWNGQEAAFRTTLIILGVLIYISQPDDVPTSE